MMYSSLQFYYSFKKLPALTFLMHMIILLF